MNQSAGLQTRLVGNNVLERAGSETGAPIAPFNANGVESISPVLRRRRSRYAGLRLPDPPTLKALDQTPTAAPPDQSSVFSVFFAVNHVRLRLCRAMFFVPFALFLLVSITTIAGDLKSPRIVESFDQDWRFLQADPADGQDAGLDDSPWQTLNVPHDWSIAGPFAATNKTSGAGAFLPSGVCWYRKHFSFPDGVNRQQVFIEFDGVMQNSKVWLNGNLLGSRPYGYVSFGYELTPYLKSTGDNILAVRCDTSAQPASRWYSGAGIYRHVRLAIVNPVHIDTDGVFVSTPEVSTAQAKVRIETTITNQADTGENISLETILFSPEGKKVASIKSDGIVTNATANMFQQEILLSRPQLWNLDSPKLYRVASQVTVDRQLVDQMTTTVGLRDAHLEADTGFWLNGKNFKLKGVCLHHDGGAFGAAVPLAIWQDRLQSLKSLGVNAIRTAHNPPAPEFLDLCDRLGFVVMDEFFDCWTVGKNPYDYHLFFKEWSARDAADTIRRDRNHPSVVLYSVGNEIHDTPKAALAKEILSGLVAVCHANDPTRPVTQALFRPNVSGDYTNGLADLLDVVGQNYRENEILAAHAQKASRKIVGTENTHDRKAWVAMRDAAPYAGQFLWTGIDYLGESRRWPVIGHQSGLLDRTARIRPLARERESWWSGTPMVAVARRVADDDQMPVDPGYGGEERHRQVLFSDWTPKDLKPHDENVEVYSNGKEVELFLNGRSLGAQMRNADDSPRAWKVAFAPGELKAVAKTDGAVLATEILRTAGQPAAIKLEPSTVKLGTGWDDVAIVRAKVVDAAGIEIPLADNLISFDVKGPGAIAAVDNGDNGRGESFQTNQCRAFQGECVAYVKAAGKSGKMILSASAAGLSECSVVIKINRSRD